MMATVVINGAISLDRYTTGSPYDLLLLSSFLWFAFAGLVAYRNRAALDAPSEQETEDDSSERSGERTWASRLAMVAVLSLPLFAIYTLRFSHEPREVPDYRLMTTLIASIPLMVIVFLRTSIADHDPPPFLSRPPQPEKNLHRRQPRLHTLIKM